MLVLAKLAAASLLVPQRTRRMIEARLLAFFCFIKRRFLIYDLDLQIGVEKFVVAKRVIGTVDTKDIAQATFVVNRSEEKSTGTASELCFHHRRV